MYDPLSAAMESQVLVVDDDRLVRDSLSRNLKRLGFSCRAVAGAEEALSALAEEPAAVVISDINMPGRDGLWLLAEIRARFQDTAVVMLTGMAEIDVAVNCLRDGASDFMTKPVRASHVVTAIDRAVERRRLILENRAYQRSLEEKVAEATAELRRTYKEITQAYQLTLEALSSALDAREQETADHSQRVMLYALELGDRVGIDGDGREHLARGALLHDIGKIGVPDHILLKPAALSEEEWVMMRRHPGIGNRIMAGIPFLAGAAQVVLCHHERYDGGGYPNGLNGGEIPLGARLFSVADTLDAMTSDRPYRKARSMIEALDEVNRCAGSQFDPEAVEAMNALGEARWLQLHGGQG